MPRSSDASAMMKMSNDVPAIDLHAHAGAWRTTDGLCNSNWAAAGAGSMVVSSCQSYHVSARQIGNNKT